MAKQSVESLVEGGKATAAPPLGPALGPLGVNIGQVVSEINKKTAEFKGMQVPIKVIVDTASKAFEITVGTPPASALIKKEANLEKGSGNPKEMIADLKIEQIIKISKMKGDSLLGKNNFAKVKEICGTCDSMGVMVEGKRASESIKEINKGAFKDKIEKGKTELTAEELKVLDEERKRLQKELEERKAELEARAKQIIKEMEGKEKAEVKAKLREAKIPESLIKTLLAEEAAAPAAEGAAAPGAAAKPGAAPAAGAPKAGAAAPKAAAKPEKK